MNARSKRGRVAESGHAKIDQSQNVVPKYPRIAWPVEMAKGRSPGRKTVRVKLGPLCATVTWPGWSVRIFQDREIQRQVLGPGQPSLKAGRGPRARRHDFGQGVRTLDPARLSFDLSGERRESRLKTH